LSVLDRIFWLRSALAVVAGVAADTVFGSDYESGLLFAAVVFMASYYLVRFIWGKSLKPDQKNKLYTTALGSYVMIFLFVWIFSFTVGLHSLNL
jgi:hypothetical protein